MTQSSNQKRNQSLRVRIFLRTLPIAVLLFALNTIYPTRRVSEEFRRQINSQIELEAKHLSELASRKIAHSNDACAAVAANDIVVNAVVDVEHRKSTLHSYIRSIRLAGAEVDNVVMTDYRGAVIAAKRNSGLENIQNSEPSWLPRVMSGRSVIAADESLITFAHPVMYSGRPEAAIVSTYRTDRFFSDLCPGSDTSFSGLSLDTKMIAVSEDAFVGDDNELVVPQDWFAQTRNVESLPGLQVSVMKSSDFVTQATNVVWQSLAIEVAGAIFVIALGLWIATSLAIGAIRDFLATIHDVQANSNLNRRVSCNTSAEFVELGEAFNSMLDKIQRTTVSRDKYRIPALVARYTDNAVVVTDRKGVIEWVNEGFTRITGYTQVEAIGRTPGSLLQGPGTDPETVDMIRTAVRNNRGVNVEILNYNKNGEAYWVDIEVRPIRNDSGKVINFIAIESEITERRRSEQEKTELNRQMVELSRQAGKAEVATGVLHNVGNALNSVNVSAEVISQRISNSKVQSLSRLANVLDERRDDIEEFITSPQGRFLPDFVRSVTDALLVEQDICRRESQTLVRSIDHIKQIVSKQQCDATGKILSEYLQLEEMADDAVRIRTSQIDEQQVELTTQYRSVPDVFADRHMVIQILVNLIGNAVNAVEENAGGNRCVHLAIDASLDGQIEFSVTDNGVGISAEQMTKIFGHGFTTKKAGHGFGLHSSILAAESMQGSLTVESPGRGMGATFSLRLPTGPKNVPSASPRSAAGVG